MKTKRFFLISLCCMLLFIPGCGMAQTKQTPPTPLSELAWESTVQDMQDLEGTDFSTYDSVYNGTCYTYEKEFNGNPGTIKYMFDDTEKLRCIAWTYSAETQEDLKALYDTLNDELVAAHGDGDFNPSNVTSYGNVWYLEEGDIILSTMITDSNKALQYAYLHPEVSKK